MFKCHKVTLKFPMFYFVFIKKSTYINRSLGYVLYAPCSNSNGKLGLLPLMSLWALLRL